MKCKKKRYNNVSLYTAFILTIGALIGGTTLLFIIWPLEMLYDLSKELTTGFILFISLDANKK